MMLLKQPEHIRALLQIKATKEDGSVDWWEWYRQTAQILYNYKRYDTYKTVLYLPNDGGFEDFLRYEQEVLACLSNINVLERIPIEHISPRVADKVNETKDFIREQLSNLEVEVDNRCDYCRSRSDVLLHIEQKRRDFADKVAVQNEVSNEVMSRFT